MATDPDIETSIIFFAEETLQVPLYWWQDKVLTWFEAAPRQRVKGALSTPNGAGKSERIVATLVLYWMTMYPQGKVVVTTKSGLQLDTQICPAITKHRSKFADSWKFIERRIVTPTGGTAIFFVTDEVGRAEGHHPVGDIFDGPVLIIVDEAKSVPEEIFEALDRCNYSALLYVSSPGARNGRFYDAFSPESGFKTLQVGLADCPHIPKERIEDITRTYGHDHPFTLSTLHGKFMDHDGEARFDFNGLKVLKSDAEAFAAESTRRTAEHPQNSPYGTLVENAGSVSYIPATERDGWIWRTEPPIPGCSYIGFCDPMTGEQSAGSKKRDGHAAGVIRLAYTDQQRLFHDTEVVACLHHYDPVTKESMVRWDNDILAERLYTTLLWYGDCMVIAEANNSGVEVLRLLKMAGATIWKREKRDSSRVGKKLDVMGFQTHTTTKSLLIGPVVAHIREETVRIRYMPAVEQMHQFVLTEDGKGESQPGAHDDWVIGIGLGLFALPSATTLRSVDTYRQQSYTQPHHTPRTFERLAGGAMS